MSSSTPLRIDLIRIDGGTQPRAHLNPETVTEYANAMADDGCVFPPVTVFYDGADYWLADGFHRVAASKEAHFSDIDADIRQGTRRDAVLFSVGANADHGLRRTNEDKRRAVLTLLNDSEWSQWSERDIARTCGVSHTFVQNMRPKASLASVASERTYTTKHGTVATMQVGNIGRTREPREEPSPAPAPRPVLAAPAPAEPAEPASTAAVRVLNALDRLASVMERWPDPADALPHLNEYSAFHEKLPVVGSWLARLLELSETPERERP